MRRLDLEPQQKLRNPGRHIRALERWSRSLEGFFPTRSQTAEGLWYDRIPIFEKVVVPPHTTPALQARCAQLMIDGAERIRDARPDELKAVPVYAYLSFPDLFSAFIEVAYAPNEHLFFNKEEGEGRQGSEDHWWEYTSATRDWVRELGLRVPAGFTAIGTGLRVFESDWMDEPCESEDWVIGDLEPR